MIKVKASGMYTSIQDKGRFGYRNLGIPLSGVMDSRSADLANALVGNNLEAAVLECTVTGPVLYFETNAKIAIVGGGCAPKIQNVAVPLHKIVHVAAGSTLVEAEIGEGTVFAYGGISVVIHERAKIGKNCMIGTNITIGGRSNIKNVPVIGDNVYIGASAIIIGDIKIGNNSTIGAGAVVLQDVPSGKTVVGNPARIIE